MSSDDSRQRAAVRRLLRQARSLRGLSKAATAAAAEIAEKTLYNVEAGGRWPQDRALRGLERALGLRPGSLDEVLENEKPENVTSSDLGFVLGPEVASEHGPSPSSTPLAGASLTELVAELLTRTSQMHADLMVITAERDALREQLALVLTSAPSAPEQAG